MPSDASGTRRGAFCRPLDAYATKNPRRAARSRAVRPRVSATCVAETLVRTRCGTSGPTDAGCRSGASVAATLARALDTARKPKYSTSDSTAADAVPGISNRDSPMRRARRRARPRRSTSWRNHCRSCIGAARKCSPASSAVRTYSRCRRSLPKTGIAFRRRVRVTRGGAICVAGRRTGTSGSPMGGIAIGRDATARNRTGPTVPSTRSWASSGSSTCAHRGIAAPPAEVIWLGFRNRQKLSQTHHDLAISGRFCGRLLAMIVCIVRNAAQAATIRRSTLPASSSLGGRIRRGRRSWKPPPLSTRVHAPVRTQPRDELAELKDSPNYLPLAYGTYVRV